MNTVTLSPVRATTSGDDEDDDAVCLVSSVTLSPVRATTSDA